MQLNFRALFKPQAWKALWAFVSAIRAYHRRDDETALAQFDRSMELEVVRTDENMAFRTVLLVMNHRPAEERLDAYRRIVAGEFRPGRASKYARAYANYWLGYASGGQDIVTLWSQAYALKPAKGFAARYLPLPDSPILQS